MGDRNRNSTTHNFNSDSVNPSLAFSAGGKILAASDRQSILLWDVASGAPKLTIKACESYDMVRSIAFSPDDNQIASGSEDQKITLWNAYSGALQQTLTGHLSHVLEIAFSPDGQLLASYDYSTLKIWDATSWTVQQTVEVYGLRLNFHQSQPFLITDQAMIRTKRSETRASSLPSQSKKTILMIEFDWITLDGEKLLRVPRDYTPWSSRFEAGLLVLIHCSGFFNVLEFDWDELDKI